MHGLDETDGSEFETLGIFWPTAHGTCGAWQLPAAGHGQILVPALEYLARLGQSSVPHIWVFFGVA